MSWAGHVGGAVSPLSRFSLNVSSNPNPLLPSPPVNLKSAILIEMLCTKAFNHSLHGYILISTFILIAQ